MLMIDAHWFHVFVFNKVGQIITAVVMVVMKEARVVGASCQWQIEMNCQRLSWLHWRSFWVIMPWALTAVTSRINIETSMYINDNRENWCQITIRISWKWLTKLYTTQCLFLSWTYFDKLISFFVQNKNCINNCVQEKLGIGSRQENVID